MIGNFHTHCTYCDGKDTPEEVIRVAIEKGFSALGFSSHVNTSFDDSYCMQDTEGYIREITALKEKYRDRIQIYLGIEEDMYTLAERRRFDYIIGSAHYLRIGEKYHSIDANCEQLLQCIAACENDPLMFAKAYFEGFCDYVYRRKPDIVGHFDLLTKFEESQKPVFLQDRRYREMACRYIDYAARSGCVFEVNTGAMSRGVRSDPYPHAELLHVLKKHNAPLIFSADSHSAQALDHGYDQVKQLLLDIGFRELYTFDNGKFIPYKI